MTSAPMRMMPRSSRSAQGVLGDVGDVAGDLFRRPSLVSRASTSYSSMWIEVRMSVCHDATGADDDGVLVVEAFPRHEGDEEVLAERDLAVGGGGAVGQNASRPPPARPREAIGALVVAGALVGATRNFAGLVGAGLGAVVVRHAHRGPRGHVGDHAVPLGGHDARPRRRWRRAARSPVPTSGAPGADQRHGLTLHVGAHQGTTVGPRRAPGTGSARRPPRPSGAGETSM